MRPHRRRLWLLAATFAVTAASRQAWADPTDQDNALALKLFDQGRALLAAGQVAEACNKLEESWRLDPLPGTLLNLAVCTEQEGRMASAVALFRQAKALAERDRRFDRLALADQHLHAIEGKVSSLVIVVGPGADRPDLSVSRDGTAVGRVVWGSEIPMDPGQHVVEATAPNKKPWKATVTVLPEGDVQTVTLDALEDATPPPATVPLAPPAVPPPTVPLPPPATVAVPEPPQAASKRRTIGQVTVASGVVVVGIASYFGVLAILRHGETPCTMSPCQAESSSRNAEAATAADLSTGAFAVGLAALGVGAFLWLGDSSRPPDKSFVSVAPSVEPGGAGVHLVGKF